MIVVDTNIIGYLFLTSTHSSLAERAYQIDQRWIAPLLWRSELRNVLVQYLRKRLLALEDAHQIMQQAIQVMKGEEYAVSSLEVLRLAFDSSCSAYDCEFVALAQELGVPLVTVDRQMLKDFPETAVSLEAFTTQT